MSIKFGNVVRKLKNSVYSLYGHLLFREYSVEKVFERLSKINNNELYNYKVSFIIPTYNGLVKGEIPRLIDSIKNQSFPNIEIVAVDSESTDGTYEYLISQGVKVIRIKKSEFRHDYSRNIGAENASGDFLVFTVQDAQFVNERWVEIALRHLLAFDAVSFSSYQMADDSDPYGKFLSYNFIRSNEYQNRSYLIGNKFLGRYLFNKLPRKLKAKAIHVDDVAHMVKKSFFDTVKYKMNTCEDMMFGKDIILSNERWIFSTLIYVKHGHTYKNFSKYFVRVFVDNMAILDILEEHRLQAKVYENVIDFLLIISAYVIYVFEKVFSTFDNSDLVSYYPDMLKNVVGRRVLHMFEVLDVLTTALRKTEYSFLVYNFSKCLDSMLVKNLFTELGLSFCEPQIMDYSLFHSVIEHVISHFWYVSHETLNNLYEALSIQDFYYLVGNAIINTLGYRLAKAVCIYKDEKSINKDKLLSLRWQ